MNRYILCLLSLTLLCSCGFFERKPLSEEEIRAHIFTEAAFDETNIDFHSKGAVGGYGFVVRIEVDSVSDAIDQLDGFELTSSYAKSDPNRVLIIEIFNASMAQYFSGSDTPEWIPEDAKCEDGTSLYKKEEDGLTVYAYQGVGRCNELFFLGSLN